jgi:two-component system response regulator DesR
VALLDIEMPGATGLEAAAQPRQELPDCKVLMVTSFGRTGYVRRAMEAGASGFWSRTGRSRSWRRRSAGYWPGSG